MPRTVTDTPPNDKESEVAVSRRRSRQPGVADVSPWSGAFGRGEHVGADMRASRELVVVGAHGGAGATTLARLLWPCWDLGSIAAAVQSGRPPVQTKGRPLVLACRNTVAGARAAT